MSSALDRAGGIFASPPELCEIAGLWLDIVDASHSGADEQPLREALSRRVGELASRYNPPEIRPEIRVSIALGAFEVAQDIRVETNALSPEDAHV